MRLSGKVFLALAAAVILGGAGWWWWRSGRTVKLTFSTATIKRGDVIASIGATGTLEPLEVVDVGAQVAGRISEFGKGPDGKPVDYGSYVSEGALLAKIDDSVYAADFSVA